MDKLLAFIVAQIAWVFATRKVIATGQALFG